MDFLSIIGLVVAFAAILVGQVLEGGHIESLINGPAMLIVVGGTVGAVMLQSPLPVFVRAIRNTLWVLKPPVPSLTKGIEKILSWSNVARREGLLGLEGASTSESDHFARKGLQLLVDGKEPDAIRGTLEVEIHTRETIDLLAAKVYEGLGGYAPTIGIIGAVMGLIHVMANLSDPSKLGSGIATAFVATIYGVGFANLVFLPIANKLKMVTQNQSQFREMTMEGLVSIAEGENPVGIEAKLQAYVTDDKKVSSKESGDRK
jgi:chemotaxis protein MotA